MEHKDEASPYDDLIAWFFEGEGFELLDELEDADYRKRLDNIAPLNALIQAHQPEVNGSEVYFLKEFLLWGLAAHKKLSKHRFSKGVQFKDLYGSYISRL